ncbi:hypothetical protein A2U01_0088616, partial [Trifolium medium]|nr:hypothetical protein [Trifolium medium]
MDGSEVSDHAPAKSSDTFESTNGFIRPQEKGSFATVSMKQK